MNVRGARPIDPGKERPGVVAEIDAVDVDVVDIEQQAAVGFGEHRIDELELRQLLGRRGVVGDVFDDELPLQQILNLSDSAGHVMHGILGEGHGHEVVEVTLVVAAEAQVLRVAAHVMGVEEGFHLFQELPIQRRRATDGQRQTVTDERKALRQALELAAEAAAHSYPVLGGPLEKIDPTRLELQELRQQTPAQTEACS